MLKVAIVCESILLKKSLELFLRDRISDFSSADIVISERKFECNKPILVVSNVQDADIKKPFGKAKLVSILENYERELEIKKEILEKKVGSAGGEIDRLEREIRELTEEFSARLIQIIKSRS